MLTYGSEPPLGAQTVPMILILQLLGLVPLVVPPTEACVVDPDEVDDEDDGVTPVVPKLDCCDEPVEA